MSNPLKAASLFLIVAVCISAVTMWQPRVPLATTPETAPLLHALDVPPIESTDTYVLQRGETLSGVLTRAGILGTQLADLLLVFREHQNPRRLAQNSEVTIRRWTTTGTPRTVEFRLNPDTTIVLAQNNTGWEGKVVLTPVIVDTVFVSGKIEKGMTVYTSLVTDSTNNLPPEEKIKLADELASIYAYTIDFSRDIHPGDSYQFAYEREARPDGSARRRRILIAEVVNQGKHYSALHFQAGSIEGYYSQEGESLRKTFRKSPLTYSRVTSSFDYRRYHPILGIYRAHLGTDYGAATGTPVYATADGTVSFAGRDGGYGNIVMLRHHSGYTSRYAHLRNFASTVRTGSKVKQDQVIGYVGATGLASGPHLHYELRLNGRAVNSRKVKLPGAPPIPTQYRKAFKQVVNDRLALLERVTNSPRLARNGQTGNSTVGGGL